MNNVWLMKTFKEWADEFLRSDFVAIDEGWVDEDYGKLSDQHRQKLFDRLKNMNPTRRYGHIKRFFDQFYDELQDSDLLVLGTGQTTKFFVTAIVRIKGKPYFHNAPKSEDKRHRFDMEILWQGDPFELTGWGWANRLEKMDTPERLKQFINMYTQLTSNGVKI